MPSMNDVPAPLGPSRRHHHHRHARLPPLAPPTHHEHQGKSSTTLWFRKGLEPSLTVGAGAKRDGGDHRRYNKRTSSTRLLLRYNKDG